MHLLTATAGRRRRALTYALANRPGRRIAQNNNSQLSTLNNPHPPSKQNYTTARSRPNPANRSHPSNAAGPYLLLRRPPGRRPSAPGRDHCPARRLRKSSVRGAVVEPVSSRFSLSTTAFVDRPCVVVAFRSLKSQPVVGSHSYKPRNKYKFYFTSLFL